MRLCFRVFVTLESKLFTSHVYTVSCFTVCYCHSINAHSAPSIHIHGALSPVPTHVVITCVICVDLVCRIVSVEVGGYAAWSQVHSPTPSRPKTRRKQELEAKKFQLKFTEVADKIFEQIIEQIKLFRRLLLIYGQLSHPRLYLLDEERAIHRILSPAIINL